MKFIIHSLSIFFGFLCAIVSSAESVVMVTDIHGEVMHEGKKLELLTLLSPATRINLSKGMVLNLLHLKFPYEYKITGPSQIRVTQQEIKGEQISRTPIAPQIYQQITTVMLNNTQDIADNLLSRAGGQPTSVPQIIQPNATKIMSPELSFSWKKIDDGYQYRVEVLSEEQDSLYLTETKASHFFLPKHIKLPREELLNWEIEASKGAKSHISSALFYIISEAEQQQIEQQRPAIDAPFGKILLFAWLLDNKGLKLEAKKYWEILSLRRPHDPVIAAKLK